MAFWGRKTGSQAGPIVTRENRKMELHLNFIEVRG
jgi:hypothetical protein